MRNPVQKLKIVSGVPWQRFKGRVKSFWNPESNRQKNFLVAITVSTNYSDLLQICLKANQSWFDQWIIVTQQSDHGTRNLLEKHPNLHVLFWDPKKNGSTFDKGTGVRTGQRFAYKRYPGSWYLLIDSDIVLEGELNGIRTSLSALSPSAVYGAERWDYGSFSDFEAKINGDKYSESSQIHGYFQLYAKPFLYTRSIDASLCDLKFRALFRIRGVLAGITCSHLGKGSNWQGRPGTPKDFVH